MSEERIVSALRALAESNRDQRASPELEGKLVAAFVRSRRARIWKRAGLGAAAAAVVVIAVAAMANYGRSVESGRRETVLVETPKAQESLSQAKASEVVVEAVPVPEVVAEVPRRTARRVSPVSVPRVSSAPVVEEVATDFFPLMDVAPPFGRGEIVRITVPAAAMRTVGLPVREERLAEFVQADVLLGEEGMARAIRFVNFTH